jgi:hypothetical protein
MARTARVTRNIRRAWPFVLMAWERWQKLPDHEKEKYKRQAREYAGRGRKLLDDRRRKKS